jgi:hypothetical protein
MICNSLYSSAQGDAAARGGRTNLDGAGASSTRSISFTPRGNGPDVSSTALRRSNVARLQHEFLVGTTPGHSVLAPKTQ